MPEKCQPHHKIRFKHSFFKFEMDSLGMSAWTGATLLHFR